MNAQREEIASKWRSAFQVRLESNQVNIIVSPNGYEPSRARTMYSKGRLVARDTFNI